MHMSYVRSASGVSRMDRMSMKVCMSVFQSVSEAREEM